MQTFLVLQIQQTLVLLTDPDELPPCEPEFLAVFASLSKMYKYQLSNLTLTHFICLLPMAVNARYILPAKYRLHADVSDLLSVSNLGCWSGKCLYNHSMHQSAKVRFLHIHLALTLPSASQQDICKHGFSGTSRVAAVKVNQASNKGTRRWRLPCPMRWR